MMNEKLENKIEELNKEFEEMKNKREYYYGLVNNLLNKFTREGSKNYPYQLGTYRLYFTLITVRNSVVSIYIGSHLYHSDALLKDVKPEELKLIKETDSIINYLCDINKIEEFTEYLINTVIPDFIHFKDINSFKLDKQQKADTGLIPFAYDVQL